VLIQNGANHDFTDILQLLNHLNSLRRQGDKNYRMFTQDERKVLYDFAFVLAIKVPGRGRGLFSRVLGFISHDGCFMSRVFRHGSFGRRKKKEGERLCIIS